MSEEKLSQDKRRSQTPTVKKTVWEKIMFPINNRRKRIALLVVLFFAFVAQGDLNIFFFKIPDFDQLTVSEGKIKITSAQTRLGTIYTLVIDKQKISFNCGIAGGGSRRDCVSIDKIPDYQGKAGKVWWYPSKNIGWLGDYGRLYQLEVNGILVISYQKQIESYLSMKKYYFYPYILFFVISIVMFFLMQFANDPITSKRNEK